MDPLAFDRLARTFSQSASRRRALAGLVGGALAAVAGVGEAKHRHHRRGRATSGKPPSNPGGPGGASACAQLCAALFAPGPDRGQCISDAAHGTGLCATCGPDPRAVCCAKTNGFCVSYATAGCCGGGCTPDCTNKACGASDGCGGTCTTCPSGQVCRSGACLATCPGATSCLIGAGGCEPPGTCLQTTSGTTLCLDLTTNVPCATDADCGQRLGIGAVCVVNPPNAPPCRNRSTPFCAICGAAGGCHASSA